MPLEPSQKVNRGIFVTHSHIRCSLGRIYSAYKNEKKIAYFFSGLNFSKIITPSNFVQLKGNTYSAVRIASVESAAGGGNGNEKWQQQKKLFGRCKNGKCGEYTALMADAVDRNSNEASKPATVPHIHKQFAFGVRLNTMESRSHCVKCWDAKDAVDWKIIAPKWQRFC